MVDDTYHLNTGVGSPFTRAVNVTGRPLTTVTDSSS
jgi:hypothetical protein